MQKYRVKIIETLAMTVEVEAENELSAEQQVNEKWRNSEYILNSDNFTGVTFEIEGKRKNMHETQEAKAFIPDDVRPVLWFMVQELDSPSPNHCFELNISEENGEVKQKVVHTQRDNDYHREFSFKCSALVVASVYIVGFGSDEWLMLMQP